MEDESQSGRPVSTRLDIKHVKKILSRLYSADNNFIWIIILCTRFDRKFQTIGSCITIMRLHIQRFYSWVSCKKDSKLLAQPLYSLDLSLYDFLSMKMKMKLKDNHFEMIDNVKKIMNDYYVMTYHRIWLSRYVIENSLAQVHCLWEMLLWRGVLFLMNNLYYFLKIKSHYFIDIYITQWVSFSVLFIFMYFDFSHM